MTLDWGAPGRARMLKVSGPKPNRTRGPEIVRNALPQVQLAFRPTLWKTGAGALHHCVAYELSLGLFNRGAITASFNPQKGTGANQRLKDEILCKSLVYRFQTHSLDANLNYRIVILQILNERGNVGDGNLYVNTLKGSGAAFAYSDLSFPGGIGYMTDGVANPNTGLSVDGCINDAGAYIRWSDIFNEYSTSSFYKNQKSWVVADQPTTDATTHDAVEYKILYDKYIPNGSSGEHHGELKLGQHVMGYRSGQDATHACPFTKGRLVMFLCCDFIDNAGNVIDVNSIPKGSLFMNGHVVWTDP